MINKTYQIIGVIGMVIIAGVSTGCKSVRFQYPNAKCQIAHWSLTNIPSVRVLPLVDLRDDKSSTEGWSMLCMLPFVPCVPFHNYDLQGFNGDVGEFDFDMKREIKDAFINHINLSGVARAHSALNGKRDNKKSYEIEFRLYDIGIDGYRTLYCLGLWPGCYIPFVGIPNTYANMVLDVEIVMKDKEECVLFQQRYKESIKYKVGMYYNWNCLKFLGMNICKIMNRFCSDVQDLPPWSNE